MQSKLRRSTLKNGVKKVTAALSATALATAMSLLGPQAASAQEACGATYTMTSGDTLSGLARQCNTSVADLMAANPGIGDPTLIPVGYQVTLPGSATAEGTYTVESGDTLFNIAREFDTTVPELMEANPEIDDPSIIVVGQELELPGEGQMGQMPSADETYTVQAGDTLYTIAQEFDTTVSELMGTNPEIDDPSMIVVGQQLDIPDQS